MATVYGITTEAEEAIAAATAETLLQLRGAAAVKAKLISWGVSFDGTSATDAPVLVRLVRQSTDGTATAASEVLISDPDGPTANVTGFHSFTAEPTASDIIELHEVHPQGGGIIRDYPYGREPVIDNATTSRLAIEVTGPAVNAVAFMHWEE